MSALRQDRGINASGGLDPYTRAALKSMVTYIPKDRLIAQWLGIAEVHVRRARTAVPMYKLPKKRCTA
jgi:hypothetical protein